MFDQLTSFSNEFVSPFLCGFRKGHITKHALINLIQNLRKTLDKSGLVGCVLMDLSKEYDCINHELLLAKLEAYGLEKSSLNLIYIVIFQTQNRELKGFHDEK